MTRLQPWHLVITHYSLLPTLTILTDLALYHRGPDITGGQFASSPRDRLVSSQDRLVSSRGRLVSLRGRSVCAGGRLLPLRREMALFSSTRDISGYICNISEFPTILTEIKTRTELMKTSG